jgi:tetraacyldisaccharide 4'-kinase
VSGRLHDWLIRLWYGPPARGRWLQPLAWLFGVAARLRRACYRRRWLPSYRSRRPVIVAGNLTVGGTGKTPFVVWLARELAARGLRVGVASRGYGRTGGTARLVADGDTAAGAGDEPLLLRRRLGRPVAVGASRGAAVRLLEADCDLILCDDGLQHYALERDLEIAVVDGARPFGNGRLLPAGPLREPASRLAEVDAVVVTGAGFEWPGAVPMRIEPVALVSLQSGERRALAAFAGRPVIAIAAIGHPERFFALLRAHGLAPETRALPDHAAFTPADAGAGTGRPVLMTEKDAVKCSGDGWEDAWYLEVEARIDAGPAGALMARIDGLLGTRRQGTTPRE